MQTFLPYAEYYSVSLLDDKRLNKQLVECQQLVSALMGSTTAYRNHPAAKMWEHNIGALVRYGLVCYVCYRDKFDRPHRSGEWLLQHRQLDPTPPKWLYDGRVQHSHRANLARKGVPAFLAPSRSYDGITKHDLIKESNIYCWPIYVGNKWIYRQKMVGGPWLPEGPNT